MKKLGWMVVTAFITIICITGCQKKEANEIIKFEAENENWTAEYIIDPYATYTDKNGYTIINVEKTLTLIYKNDLSILLEVKKMKISYDDKRDGGSSSRTFDDKPLDNKKFIIKFESETPVLDDKNDVIKVSIELDGKVEKLELVSK